MEKALRLSEFRQQENIGEDEKKILKLLGSTSFKFFLKYILRDGELSIGSDGIKMNGKDYNFDMIGKKEREKMSENGITNIIIKKDFMSITMKNEPPFDVIID